MAFISRTCTVKHDATTNQHRGLQEGLLHDTPQVEESVFTKMSCLLDFLHGPTISPSSQHPTLPLETVQRGLTSFQKRKKEPLFSVLTHASSYIQSVWDFGAHLTWCEETKVSKYIVYSYISKYLYIYICRQVLLMWMCNANQMYCLGFTVQNTCVSTLRKHNTLEKDIFLWHRVSFCSIRVHIEHEEPAHDEE